MNDSFVDQDCPLQLLSHLHRLKGCIWIDSTWILEHVKQSKSLCGPGSYFDISSYIPSRRLISHDVFRLVSCQKPHRLPNGPWGCKAGCGKAGLSQIRSQEKIQFIAEMHSWIITGCLFPFLPTHSAKARWDGPKFPILENNLYVVLGQVGKYHMPHPHLPNVYTRVEKACPRPF